MRVIIYVLATGIISVCVHFILYGLFAYFLWSLLLRVLYEGTITFILTTQYTRTQHLPLNIKGNEHQKARGIFFFYIHTYMNK